MGAKGKSNDEKEARKIMAKNADYTDSAVNLTNPEVVITELGRMASAQQVLKNANAALIETEAYKNMIAAEENVSIIIDAVKALVDTVGSYQNIEAGI